MILKKEHYQIKGYLKSFFLGIILELKTYKKNAQSHQQSTFYQDLCRFPQVNIKNCFTCNLCVDACPSDAIVLVGNEGCIPNKLLIENKFCTRCLLCVDICPTSALRVADSNSLDQEREG